MKLNKSGFTLIELLGVIVLLAVITTVAVPSAWGIARKLKQNMLETKIDLILEDAKLYGQDHLSEIAQKPSKFNSLYSCTVVSIQNLVDLGYLSSDKEESGVEYVINPVDNSFLNNEEIIIYIKNKRVVTVMADEDLDTNRDNYCS